MGDKLKNFLRSVPDDEVDELYAWLDGNPDAVEEMKIVLAFSHKTLDVVRKKSRRPPKPPKDW